MSAGRKNTDNNKEWGTPIKIINSVAILWNGEISLDPCSNDYSLVKAKREIKLPLDGLKENWGLYSTIFVNPPYGKDYERKTNIANWIEKCCETNWRYQNEVIALIPVATNTKHWKNYIWGKAKSICFLYDSRLKFLENGVENKKGAPMACCLVYWGKYPLSFKIHFSHLGYVTTI